MRFLLHLSKSLLLMALVGPAFGNPTPTPALERPALKALAAQDWTVFRVSGDAKAVWDAAAKEWSAGDSSIDTALPEGYPAPTPPGAIELKKYPQVRRAEFTGQSGDSGSGFMPLFRHIQRNDIPMTSPVEVDYKAPAAKPLKSDGWTMSFLYRTPKLHPEGPDAKDARVVVKDAEPVTVLSLGGRGSYDTDRVEQDFATLRTWLAANPEWEEAGPGRAFFYNGPSWRPWRKWLEVQIPVRPRKAATD